MPSLLSAFCFPLWLNNKPLPQMPTESSWSPFIYTVRSVNRNRVSSMIYVNGQGHSRKLQISSSRHIHMGHWMPLIMPFVSGAMGYNNWLQGRDTEIRVYSRCCRDKMRLLMFCRLTWFGIRKHGIISRRSGSAVDQANA